MTESNGNWRRKFSTPHAASAHDATTVDTNYILSTEAPQAAASCRPPPLAPLLLPLLLLFLLLVGGQVQLPAPCRW